MFIDIVSPKKPLEAEKLFRACWRQGAEITPEIYEEVLKSTNFATCIKRAMECITRLPASRQAAFRELVLATFDGREQPEAVVEIGERLAQIGGYAQELKSVFGKMDAKQEYVLASHPGVERLKVSKKNYYDNRDFLSGERFLFGAKDVSFHGVKNFPEVLNLAYCERVRFTDCDLSNVQSIQFRSGGSVTMLRSKNLPHDLDFTPCAKVDLGVSRLGGLENLKFGNGAKVDLTAAKDLPEVLDFSNCDEVILKECDLKNVKNLTFKKGAKVNLSKAKNLKGELDVSELGEVDLGGLDMHDLERLVLADRKMLRQSKIELPKNATVELVIASEERKKREQAGVGYFMNTKYCHFDFADCEKMVFIGPKVFLWYARNLAGEIVFAKCDDVKIQDCDLSEVTGLQFKAGASVDLSYCDLWAVEKLAFGDGAKVKLWGAKNLPADLDVSKCDEVYLSSWDMSKFECLRFKQGAKAVFSHVGKFPKRVDFSGCNEVSLRECHLAQFGSLRFAKAAKVDLSEAWDVPKRCDFSNCDEVNLSKCHLRQLVELKFKRGAKVNMFNVASLPAGALDFSACAAVNLAYSNMDGVEGLKFGEGARVNLTGVKGGPKALDVSACGEVKLEKCALDKVEKITFADFVQLEASGAEFPRDWKGALVVNGEEVSVQYGVVVKERAEVPQSAGYGFMGRMFKKGR